MKGEDQENSNHPTNGANRRVGRSFRQADKYAGVGFQVAVALVFYVVAGNWLDKKLGTDPWLTLVGAVLGFGSMMFILIRFAGKSSR